MLKRSFLDVVGFVLSATCLVHCLLLPVVLALVPVSALAGISDPAFHFLLAWIILPVSGLALVLGVYKHRRWSIALIGGLGLVLIIAAATIGHDGGLAGERWLTVIGSVLIAGAHLVNFRASERGRVG
ncbi:MAG: MerC domain-containing protein [Pseudomonadota bacterium]